MSFLDYLAQLDSVTFWGFVIISSVIAFIVLYSVGFGSLALVGIAGLMVILILLEVLPVWTIPIAIAILTVVAIFKRGNSI